MRGLMSLPPNERNEPMPNVLGALLADPGRPLGAPEIAALLAPYVSADQVGTWHRRGLMPPPRWTVSRCPAWAAADVAAWLEEVPVHVADGRVTRCGRTAPTSTRHGSCIACRAGSAPTVWAELLRQQEAPVA